jgi:hypothetical protein
VERVVPNALALGLESPSGEGDSTILIPKFFSLRIENRFQRKIRIKMIGSEPVAIEEC